MKRDPYFPLVVLGVLLGIVFVVVSMVVSLLYWRWYDP